MTEFKGFVVEDPDAAQVDSGERKITTWTDSPVSDNANLRLWVGDQQLRSLRIDQTGTVIDGLVDQEPDPTDTLKFQHRGVDKTDTGLTAETKPGNT